MRKEEPYSDAKEILRKRILEEQRAIANAQNANISQDEPLDPAFPLFLSFRANDSIESVSEGIREKNIQMNPQSGQEDVLFFESNQKSNIIGTIYTETGIPIFKPYTTPKDESDDLYNGVPARASTNDELSMNSSSETPNTSHSLPLSNKLPAKRNRVSVHPSKANLLQPHIVRSKKPGPKCKKQLLFLALCISILVSIFIFLINFDVASLLNSLFS